MLFIVAVFIRTDKAVVAITVWLKLSPSHVDIQSLNFVVVANTGYLSPPVVGVIQFYVLDRNASACRERFYQFASFALIGDIL